MAFHEILFPVNPDAGVEGGPGFRTNVFVMDSGQRRAVQHHNQMQHRYNAGFQVKTHDDIYTILEFYRRIDGVSGGFRFKDWGDYTSTNKGRLWGDDNPGNVNDINQLLGIGDGSKTVFQLVKVYGDSTPQKTRVIRKPVSGTVVIALDAVSKTEGVDFTVDTTTGEVTFMTAPALGVQVTGGFEFDVPVYFGVEVDQVLSGIIQDFGSSRIPNIPLVEILDTNEVDERIFYGNATQQNITANFTLSQQTAKVWAIDVQSSGLKATLPAFANLSLGGPYFVLVETGGSNSLAVHDNETDTLQFTLSASGHLTIYLGVDSSGSKKWYATS